MNYISSLQERTRGPVLSKHCRFPCEVGEPGCTRVCQEYANHEGDHTCWNCNPWLGFGVAHKGILCKKTFALTRFANNRILSRRVAHKGIL